ncbi:MAG TPA: DEAD/DEAH box helicase, partial [Erysipelothrix sp.]|nr:DEAD/DEAH box helicase [Erysipelothrix sp.]
MYFNELNLKPELLQAIEELGYYEPTEIQEQAIPAVLAGKDVLGQSHTGSGKTAAFGLPLLNLLTETDASNQTEALIILPTRELCLQVANELRKFATYSKEMSVVALYGGEPIDRQIRLLKRGKRIVVATPGRLLDHLRRRTIRVQNLQILVLDEADEMLNMGFYEDIVAVMAYL